jgi:hypothetical protein
MRAKRLLGMVLKLLATGTASLFIAACYGVMMQWKKITITAVSPESAAIPGLLVTLRDPMTDVASAGTDASGVAAFDQLFPVAGLQASIVDVDGAANGGQFKRADIDLDKRDAYTVTLNRE